jgi:streptogramin lyase
LNVDAQNNIWFGIWSAGNRSAKLDKLDQTTGRITEYTIPRRNSNPYDVMQDADGNIWSADVGGTAASIWKFNPRDQTFTLYPKPQKSEDSSDERWRSVVLAAWKSGRTRLRRVVSGYGQDHDARRVLSERPAGVSVQARRVAAAEYGDEIVATK